MPGIEIGEFAVPDHVENYEEKLASLREERRAYLAAFEDLDEEITEAVY